VGFGVEGARNERARLKLFDVIQRIPTETSGEQDARAVEEYREKWEIPP
jgi:hypothetical protein